MTVNSLSLCARPGCGEAALPKRKYCSDACRIKVARARYDRRRADVLEGLSLEERVELERSRIANREAARTLLELQRSAAKRREYIDAIKSVLEPYEPFELSEPEFDTNSGTHVAWAFEWSDWQLGQKTPIVSTGGVFEQSTNIVKAQVDHMWEGIQSIFQREIVASGVKLDEIWNLFNGDIVDGDSLRPAHRAQVDIPVTQQVIESADLMALTIQRQLLLPGIKMIHVDIIGGNHDRTTSRPGNAGLGEADFVDTYAWLQGAILQRWFENEPRVRITNWESFYGYREFAGLRHAFEHGASIRSSQGSYGGIPWYPIMNAVQSYDRMLGGIDVFWLGHFHRPAFLPLGQSGWVVMNGALPPSSEYIQSNFKGVREPMQWLVEFNVKKRWVNNVHALYADIGVLQKPGALWNAQR